MRWDPYVLSSGDDGFDRFWTAHLAGKARNLLFIVGRGFDPRALEAPQRIIKAGGQGNRHVWILAFDNGMVPTERSVALTTANIAGFEKLFPQKPPESIPVRIGGAATRTFTSMNTKRAIDRLDDLKTYTDIVVDVSAMPRMVGLTVVAQLTALLDDHHANRGSDINLHVVVTESVSTDRGTTKGSLSENVTYVVGFSGHLDAQSTEHFPRVWLPVLGEDQNARLELIRQEVNPDEICPVVPFPSRDPRRGDAIIEEYRQELFDSYEVEPTNILQASEYNPFEAYRQLYSAIDRYRDALKELDGCKVFVSPLSSKLLSVGALLACYDHVKHPISGGRLYVGMPYVETATYGDPWPLDENAAGELYSMWIRGEWER